MRQIWLEMAEVLFDHNVAIFENQQTIDVLLLGDVINRLLTPLKFKGKIRNEVTAVFKHKEPSRVTRDIHRGDHLAHVAERPAVERSELKGR